jgi:hypothetical protein
MIAALCFACDCPSGPEGAVLCVRFSLVFFLDDPKPKLLNEVDYGIDQNATAVARHWTIHMTTVQSTVRYKWNQ